eukprot:3555698-Prymnesium_polylepis.1
MQGVWRRYTHLRARQGALRMQTKRAAAPAFASTAGCATDAKRAAAPAFASTAGGGTGVKSALCSQWPTMMADCSTFRFRCDVGF